MVHLAIAATCGHHSTNARPCAGERTAIMFEHLYRMQRQLGRAYRLVTIDGGDAIYRNLGDGWSLEIYPSFYRGWDIHFAHHNAILASRYDVPACRIKQEVERLLVTLARSPRRNELC